MIQIDKELILKYNRPGPRYTSYPPANYFHNNLLLEQYQNAILASNQEDPKNISLYVHIPFCPRLCHFCGCNTLGSKNPDLYREYVDAVKIEINNVAASIDKTRKVTQIHWGGGTPNSIPLTLVREIMDLFRELFSFDENIEVAMECSPAYLELEDIDALRAMGFNRLSLGIQDFNDHVLEIVNRDASKLPVTSLVNRMREQGFDGVNLDIIYGLPGQTPENFKYNIERTIEVNPDRIATFSYAHVPWVKKAQSVLEKVGIPSADEKLELMKIAFDLLTKNGYVPIGMDHFAKKEDSLFRSMENNNLHRNFQGYCTKETTGQVYGFGSSSISQLDNGYYQNTKVVKEYIERVNQTGWAFEKGYQVNRNEKIIREVINEVMCNLFVDFKIIGNKFNISAEELREILAFDKEKLAEFIQDDLVVLDGDRVNIKENGAMVIRNIAMAFDPNLTVSANQYSKTI